MSVLQSKRTTSKAEFINNAIELNAATMAFLTRLSIKYSRLMASKISDISWDILTLCEEANSIFPSNEITQNMRYMKLKEALAKCNSLDVALTTCYQVMNYNPQGCFEKDISASSAKQKIGKAAEKLGLLIDKERTLIKSVMISDKKRWKNQ